MEIRIPYFEQSESPVKNYIPHTELFNQTDPKDPGNTHCKLNSASNLFIALIDKSERIKVTHKLQEFARKYILVAWNMNIS